VSFQISQASDVLSVHYVGRDPLPDTLGDEAEAVVEGYLQGDGNFEAHKVQAKCASKYEAEYGEQ
jgi:cytochrome c-type biogenesis protein CcmE